MSSHTSFTPFPPLNRRRALKWLGVTAASLSTPLPVMAGPFEAADFDKLVPADKKLDAAWVKSLFERGTKTIYRGADLKHIGMPVGGLCAGQVYIGGDGRLWHWDIFNKHVGTGAEHYANPLRPSSPFEQSFYLHLASEKQPRRLDATGFSDVAFSGEYPIATVEYKDRACPIAVALEAFSPFIPLNTADSSLPATVLRFTLKNTSGEAVDATLAGTLQNAVCLGSLWFAAQRINRIVRDRGVTFLSCSAEASQESAATPQPDIVFEDWSKDTYDGWKVEGTAFGKGPIKRTDMPKYQGDVGGDTERVVNSHASAPGTTVESRDNATGKLTSRTFRIDRNFINFWIGGGNHKGRTCLNLVVDGKVAQSATGKADNRMAPQTLNVRTLKGREAHVEIVDAQTGPWGNIGVGKITFSDKPAASGRFEDAPDFGTMGLALLGDGEGHAGPIAAGTFPANADRRAQSPSVPLDQPLIGSVSRRVQLAPGASATVEFVLTWHFPNLSLGGMGKVGRSYATRFESAQAVAQYVADNSGKLFADTRLFRDTWYDSTLPFWFLDRTLLNTSILATSTCFRFANGRFYGWEGVGCCAGTCGHVYHYAHAIARLFPELERSARELADYGVGFDADTGRIRFRAEHNNIWAVDGQSGSILRAYREHQVSTNDQFLRRLWPRIKKSIEFLMSKDAGRDGIMDGPQHNTLDTDWYGEIAWLSSLYLAALRAGEEMAREMNDEPFAGQCREVFAKGRDNLVQRLFNDEYFMNRVDPRHLDAINSGTGCEIDQVFGQSWAFQVGLGRILPQNETLSALHALWKYNFAPDVGAYRAAHKPGRWYAMPGEAGLLMCTFPKPGWNYDNAKGKGPDWAAGYFNECMNGFEYQVAWHMIAEGMLHEGLAVTRAIHDRYHGSRRNPWNEVECGDHYARSMASYGAFLAACGFEYHGTRGHIGFAPKLSPEKFRAAFTAAEGWGTYAQRIEDGALIAQIGLKWGNLNARTLAFELPEKVHPASARVTVNGRMVDAQQSIAGRRVLVTLAAPARISAGQTIEVAVA